MNISTLSSTVEVPTVEGVPLSAPGASPHTFDQMNNHRASTTNI
jgi:hypothetical protein